MVAMSMTMMIRCAVDGVFVEETDVLCSIGGAGRQCSEENTGYTNAMCIPSGEDPLSYV